MNHWYVTFSCEVEEEPLPPCEEAVGIDLGVLHFATLSTGETIENPRPYRRGLKRIKLLATGQGPQKAWLPSAQTGGDRAGKSPSTGAQPTERLSAPGSACPGQSLWPVVFEDLKITNMSKAPEPKPDPEQEGPICPMGQRPRRA